VDRSIGLIARAGVPACAAGVAEPEESSASAGAPLPPPKVALPSLPADDSATGAAGGVIQTRDEGDGALKTANMLIALAILTIVSAAAADPPAPAPPAAGGGTLLAEALAGPLAGVEEIVFGVSRPIAGSFAPFNAARCDPSGRTGAQLCKLNLRTGKATVLLEDRSGELRDIQVHYDGQKAIFAYGKGGDAGNHLYEIEFDGSGLKRITPDDDKFDVSPCYLPNDDIVFCSTRSLRYVGCASSYATTLHRCRPDGSRLHPISASLEIERGVGVLGDGRLIFLHWEYYHRGTHGYHPLYSCNPDGTGFAVAYGNMRPDGHGWWPETPRQMPGSDRIVFVNGQNGGGPMGTLSYLDPALGPDDPAAIRRVPGSPKDCLDPCPLGGDWIMAGSPDGIVLLDGRGKAETIYSRAAPCFVGKDFWVLSPQPVRPRAREPVLADRVELSATTGRFMLTDVSVGRNMAGVKPGEVKRLLVLEWLPTPIGPIWPKIRSAWFINRVLGTVPVEADGSAYFEAPAGRAYAFAPLDERGLSVKHMQSAAHVMPGEVAGCVGCHEPRPYAGLSGNPMLAVKRGVSRIEPFAGIPDRLDYIEDIQPIWDRHCAKCHNPDKRSGGVLMTADRGGNGVPHSYLSLMAAGQVVDCGGPNQWGNNPPRRMGSGGSPLMRKLDGSHHDVKVSPLQWQTVALWLDTMIPWSRYYGEQRPSEVRGISAEAMRVIERRCFTCHVRHEGRKGHCGGEMWPGFRTGENGGNFLFYPEANPSHENDLAGIAFMKEGGKALKAGGKAAADYERAFQAWFQECFGCNEAQLRRGRAIVVNADHPEKSLLLLAPLAKKAGGYATASEADVKAGKVKACPILFSSAADADYQAILAGLPRVPPSDRSGLVSVGKGGAGARLREFGFIPESLPDKWGRVNIHPIWEQYWKSLWWKPMAAAPSAANANE
jgi:hypothetical protein